MFRAGVDEVHEAGTAVELGKEDGGVGLRLWALDPLKTRSDTAILAATFAKNPATITTHTHFGFVFLLFLEI